MSWFSVGMSANCVILFGLFARGLLFSESFKRLKIFFPGVTKYRKLFTWRYSFLWSAFCLNELLDSELNFKLYVFTYYFHLSHCIVCVWLVNEHFLPFKYYTSPPCNFNTTV